ncbi:unnamed protein product [Arctia plantaginis]|uniref:Uncharacterized protein n=1 Tax=Arctia plantaginis TaxID=874455 RepID=A0A8S1BHH3_ARCPL|nr:unnamed protein product [Arctia plantaginis]CAB3258398.1 unnamed protein product [Arctia plantaginis]
MPADKLKIRNSESIPRATTGNTLKRYYCSVENRRRSKCRKCCKRCLRGFFCIPMWVWCCNWCASCCTKCEICCNNKCVD